MPETDPSSPSRTPDAAMRSDPPDESHSPEPGDIDDEADWVGYNTKLAFYPGSPGPELTEESVQEVCREVVGIYDSGTPFFTKAAMRSLVDQFDACDANGNYAPDQVFVITALNGCELKFPPETNNIFRFWPQSDNEIIIGKPYCHYSTCAHLTGHPDSEFFSPEMVYCPIRITYDLLKRNRTTRDFVNHDCEPFEKVRDAFDANLKVWEDGDVFRALESNLRAIQHPPRITSIVAFACSTMSRKAEDKWTRRTMTQHALILAIRNALSTKSAGGTDSEDQVKCFAQDPVYTDADAAVLLARGIKVVQDPRGFLEVDDESVVLSFSPNIPVKQIITDIARPAMLVWNKVRTLEEACEMNEGYNPADFCDAESSRVLDMIQREYYKLMDFEEESALSDIVVYVKRI